ncbi:2-succinyl-6-hydroxy-2,4-cyclohexadiene-1-carboxylate synthase [Pseudalkalibacillus hwajinpoensis]|uniref:2-succinyl-6-hydroxy-2, 4-cyclohexadiene-1-carboxylate synthase n=1 Tax=Guptibacillus hwajinpoensis TaxID=208199 RepID=UPI00325BC9B0
MKISIDNLNFHIIDEGKGETIVLLHGFTGNALTWESFINKWSSSYRIIAIDLIGHGESSKPADASLYTMEAMSRFLKEILDICRLDHVHLLGYSMGGRLALSFAMQYPSYVKTLLLESSSPGLRTVEEREERIRKDYALARKILDEGMLEFVSYWETIPLFSSQQHLSEALKSELREQRITNSEVGLANSLIGMGTGAQPSYWESLHELGIPVLLLTGEYDNKFISIAKRMASAIPRADIVQINDAGHTIHVEQTQIFDKMVVAFLEKHV